MSKVEMILNQVRTLLQSNGVKLWLQPYYVEGIGPNEEEIQKLASAFVPDIEASLQHIIAAISELQSHALEKLRARETFQQSGIATIKVRTPVKPRGTKILTIQISLNGSGLDLQKSISKELELPEHRVKIIASGRVVELDKTLASQSIVNNQQLMAVILDERSEKDKTSQDIYDRVQKAREDAQLFINSRTQHVRLEDQQGNAVYLPPTEHKSLLMAMAMNEKGRALLKKDNFSEALIFFLEADREFDLCTSSILDTVDNYALLNLDIVWCYFSLQSLQQLSDAERRLKVCEKSFEKSYGRDLARLREVKGTNAGEYALVMRLHLLQAVVMYHMNNFKAAQKLLSKAEVELSMLKVDEEVLVQLTEMGYSSTEARIALRSTVNNLERAIDFIINKRNSRDEARRKRKLEEKSLREVGAVELANDNDYVNPRDLKVLSEMGFDKVLAAAALRKTNNNLPEAITELQENGESLRAEMTPNEVCVNEIVAMGFDREAVMVVLSHVMNNRQKCIDILEKLKNEGALLNSDDVASTSSGTNSKHAERRKKLSEAIANFASDVSNECDDHLDLPLDREEAVLNEYKKLLKM